MPVSSAKFYYLQTAGPWNDLFELSGDTPWIDMAVGSVVIPDSMHFEEGAEPDKLIFHVLADSSLNSNGIYPAIATHPYDAAHRPDGTVGPMAFPAHENASLREFTIIRLMEGDGPIPDADADIPRWVGIITGATLDLSVETWTVEAIDLVRWRLECYVVKGLLWNDNLVPRFYPKMLPVFNADGKRDCVTSNVTGLPYLLFDRSNKPSEGTTIVGYWRLGDVLNYLRKCWYTLYLGTGKTLIEVAGISRFAEWPEVDAGNYPWLFTGLAASKNTVSDLVLGGLTVNEAIDTVIKLAGGGWAPRYQADGKYLFEFWPKSGRANVALTRGSAGSTPGDMEETEPDMVGGLISLDWTNVRSHTIVPGVIHAHECTIVYDPLNVTGDVHPRIVAKGWSDYDRGLYDIANSEAGFDPNALNARYPDVFQKWIIDPASNWNEAFYTDAPDTPSRKGAREFLDMVSTFAGKEITAKVWRWEDGAFAPAPVGVTLQFNKDGSFQISGYNSDDEPTAASKVAHDADSSVKLRYPRYLEPAEEETFRLFAITLCVAGDERAWGEDKSIPEGGYPTSLEDCATPVRMQNASVKSVRHFLTFDAPSLKNIPCENGDLWGISDLGLGEQVYIEDNRKELNAMATRRRDEVLYPKVKGSIKMRKFVWDILPGMRLQELTGGGDPALPTIQVGGLIKKVSFLGLGLKGAESEQLLELGD